MAIVLDDQLSNQDDEKVFRINNGDLQALKRLQDDWGFKNLESVIAFAVGVLRQADGSKRVLVQTAGTDIASPVTPNDSLLKKPTSRNPAP
jgi:hypothetical protein